MNRAGESFEAAVFWAHNKWAAIVISLVASYFWAHFSYWAYLNFRVVGQ